MTQPLPLRVRQQQEPGSPYRAPGPTYTRSGRTVTVRHVSARAGQRLAAYFAPGIVGTWKTSGDVWVQPFDMRPSSVPKCSALYTLTIELPGDVAFFQVYQRGDEYAGPSTWRDVPSSDVVLQPAAGLGIGPQTGAARPGGPVRWALLVGVFGLSVWWIVRRSRYTPNRSAKQEKAALGRSAERDSVARARHERDRKVEQIRARGKRVRAKLAKSCAATRARASDEVRAMREKERERINRKADAIRGKARAACHERRVHVRDLLTESRRLADDERDERIRLAHQLASVERKQARTERSRERSRARRESAQESDSEVERNIDRELLPVWRSVKRGIRGTPKMSRTEAFLHWVEENESEVWAIREDQIASELDDLAAEEAAYYASHAAE